MVDTRITLDVAAFLDSPAARALSGPRREDVRRIAEAILGACYEDLGKEPRLLDDHDARELLTHLLPGRLRRHDPVAEHVPSVMYAFLAHLEATQVVVQAFELRRGIDEAMDEFHTAVRTGDGVVVSAASQDPIVHRAPKLGRNDPCFCGSGKKFKKCHGR